MLEKHLVLADKHVAAGEQHIAQQLAIIERLHSQGLDTTVAELHS